MPDLPGEVLIVVAHCAGAHGTDQLTSFYIFTQIELRAQETSVRRACSLLDASPLIRPYASVLEPCCT